MTLGNCLQFDFNKSRVLVIYENIQQPQVTFVKLAIVGYTTQRIFLLFFSSVDEAGMIIAFVCYLVVAFSVYLYLSSISSSSEEERKTPFEEILLKLVVAMGWPTIMLWLIITMCCCYK